MTTSGINVSMPSPTTFKSNLAKCTIGEPKPIISLADVHVNCDGIDVIHAVLTDTDPDALSSTNEGNSSDNSSDIISMRDSPASDNNAWECSSLTSPTSDGSDFGDDMMAEYMQIMSAHGMYPRTLLLAARPSCNEPSAVCYSTRSIHELPGIFPVETPEQEPIPNSTPSQKRGKGPSLLIPSVGSWAATKKQKASVRTDDETVNRAMRSILNKLTVEKFDRLYEQLATCGFSTPAHIAQLMHEIFEKATDQHHFIAMYADLCVRLEADSRITLAFAEEEGTTFRRLLLNQCQTAFEQLLKPKEEEIAQIDDEYLKDRRKKTALGNVKLVGQLFVRGMLNSKILCQCSTDLMLAQGRCPEALESLAALLTITGPKFDTPEWQHRPLLEVTFKHILELTKEKTVPARDRFLLRDLLDLREAGWPSQARPTAAPSGPMRLEEVRMIKEQEDAAPATSDRKTHVQKSHGKVKESAAPAATDRKINAQKCSSGSDSLAGLLMICKGNKRDSQKDFKSPTGCNSPKGRNSPKGPKNTVTDAARVPQSSPAAPTTVGTPAFPTKTVAKAFDAAKFHRDLWGILCDLSKGGNILTAVGKICDQQVPLSLQAQEFADLLTRAVEEKPGRPRRSIISLARSIACLESSTFDHAECLAGVQIFFDDIVDDLSEEVPQLEIILAKELLPELRLAFTRDELRPVVSESWQANL